MSSIVKKSSHFTPKLKKRAVRKEATATPPASQIAEDVAGSTGSKNASVGSENATNTALQNQALPLSPPASQAPTQGANTETNTETGETRDETSENVPAKAAQNALFNYSIAAQATGSSVRKPATEPVVDPMQKAPTSASIVNDNDNDNDNNDNDDDNEYGENDIFSQQAVLEQAQKRRPSAAIPRRLSGINNLNINRRNSSVSGSISGTPAMGGSLHTDAESVREVPVPINVPMGKPTKKRRMSSVSKAGRKQPRGSVSAISIPSAAEVLKEEQHEAETAVESSDKANGTDATSGSTNISIPTNTSNDTPTEDFVIGLCPKTGKVRKFKTGEHIPGALPVAPADLVTMISSVRQLPRRVKPEDEELFSRVMVQADEISMADLCKPTIQIGQKCETFELAEAAKERILEKKAERRRARERARELRIPYRRALREIQGEHGNGGENGEEDGDGENDGENGGAARESVFEKMARALELANNSTLKLAVVEGQIQLDQESVVRSRGAAPNSENRTVEVENPFENPITANSYSNNTHTDAWTTEERVELYRALSTWGTDFTFIAQLFPYRTRRQIKNKFTLEEKHNPQLIELALRRKLPPNFAEFCAHAASIKTPITIEEFNREIAELKQDHETHMREISAEREKAIKEDLETNRKREIEIRTGAKPMTKAERARMIRQNEVVVGEIDDVKRAPPREVPDAY